MLNTWFCSILWGICDIRFTFAVFICLDYRNDYVTTFLTCTYYRIKQKATKFSKHIVVRLFLIHQIWHSLYLFINTSKFTFASYILWVAQIFMNLFTQHCKYIFMLNRRDRYYSVDKRQLLRLKCNNDFWNKQFILYYLLCVAIWPIWAIIMKLPDRYGKNSINFNCYLRYVGLGFSKKYLCSLFEFFSWRKNVWYSS